MFDNNIRPISMWSRGGWDEPEWGPGRGEGGTWSGVISEADGLNNWEAELRGGGIYYEFNPFSVWMHWLSFNLTVTLM